MTQLLRYLPQRLLTAAMLPLLLLAAVTRAEAADGQQRFPIELEQVKTALQTANLTAMGGDADVRLLAHLTATSAEPQLEVSEIVPWGGRGAHVRLVCMAREECLPFYVAIQWPEASLARAALLAVGVPAPAIDRAAGVAGSQAPVSLPRVTANAISRPVETVRSGSRALLKIDGERLHIQLPVICLESGAAGNTIRVTGLDRRQTYEALVVDAKLLKGRL